jgi:hypothetical protein
LSLKWSSGCRPLSMAADHLANFFSSGHQT